MNRGSTNVTDKRNPAKWQYDPDWREWISLDDRLHTAKRHFDVFYHEKATVTPEQQSAFEYWLQQHDKAIRRHIELSEKLWGEE